MPCVTSSLKIPISNIKSTFRSLYGGATILDAFFTCLTGGINAYTRAIKGTGVLAGLGAASAGGLSAGSLAALFAGITAALGIFLVGYCLGYATFG